MQVIAAILLFSTATNAWAGSSRSFDGVSDSINYTHPTALVVGTDSFTSMAWIYWTDGVDAEEVVQSQQDGTGTGRTWMFVNDSNTTCGTAEEFESFLGGSALCDSDINPDVWRHFAVRSNEASGVLQLVLDGAQAATSTRAIEAATGTQRLGVHKTGTTNDWEGQISYFLECEGALTDAQINEIRWNPHSAWGYCGTGFLIFSPLWGSNDPELDLTGNGVTGSLTGTSESANGPPVMLGHELPL